MSVQFLASAADLIRQNGSGRVFFKPVGGNGYVDLGDVDDLSANYSEETSSLNSNRTAAKAKVRETTESTDLTMAATCRELPEFNVAAAFRGDDFQDANQAEGYRALAEFAGLADDMYVDLGHRDPFVLKLHHGAVSGGPFEVGETVTGGTSSATGVVAWQESGFLELVNISGDFEAGEEITGGTSMATVTATSVERVDDVVVVDSATPTTRYVQGVDYDLEPEVAMLRQKSGGSIAAAPFVAYNHPALVGRYTNLLAGTKREGAFRFISDAGDSGPRFQLDLWRVPMTLNGDVPFIGTGGALTSFPFSFTALADDTRPLAERYGRITMLKPAA